MRWGRFGYQHGARDRKDAEGRPRPRPNARRKRARRDRNARSESATPAAADALLVSIEATAALMAFAALGATP